jgi:hypothetical protein
MASTENLMAGGIQASVAKQIGLEVPVTGLTATGSTQAGALALTSNCSIFATVGASTGCLVSADKDSFIFNGGSNTLSVYPPIGAGFNFNGGTVNAAFSISAGKGGYFVPSRGSIIAAMSG